MEVVFLIIPVRQAVKEGFGGFGVMLLELLCVFPYFRHTHSDYIPPLKIRKEL